MTGRGFEREKKRGTMKTVMQTTLAAMLVAAPLALAAAPVTGFSGYCILALME